MENIGDIIRRQRKSKNMTQEELGEMLFVKKQSVSKWETGRTLPDIETLRKLCDILDIKSHEILGGSVSEVKHCRRWMKVCVFIVLLSLLCTAFFGLGGLDYIDRHTQSSVAFLTVYKNGTLLTADEYTVQTELNCNHVKNGYKFDIKYGEIRGVACFDDLEVEYGFVNSNNWHNVQIRLDVELSDEILSVKQAVSYETDNDVFEVLITEDKGIQGEKISVFRDGV